ncbi:MAG: hypothetical protein Q7U26_14985, partial [Aquabacterium sp.]|nr:hypothetical protein [Aquabacterium sp.]
MCFSGDLNSRSACSLSLAWIVMKLSLPMLLLGMVIALAAATPAQARSEVKKAASVKISKAAGSAKARSRVRPVAVRVAQTRRVAALASVPARPSFGQMQGLHTDGDALDLKSSVALVIDQDTNEVLFSK